MLSQHHTKCSDEALSGVRVSCKVLQHGHIVQSRRGERVVCKQLEKELRREEEDKLLEQNCSIDCSVSAERQNN